MQSYMNNQWKINEKLKSTYNYMTIHLNSRQSNMLENKAKMIFKEMYKSLHEHFKSWVNRLLYLSLFSETETATVVSLHLLQITYHPDATVEFYSRAHSRDINLLNFDCFLKTNSIDILNPFDDLPVSMIHQGLDM